MSAIHSGWRMPGALTPMNTSAPTRHSFRSPRTWRGLVTAASSVCAADSVSSPVQSAPSRSTTTTSRDAGGDEQRDDRGPGRTRPRDHDPALGQLLLDHPQRVGERREHHDRGAVLVVVEDRDVQALAQPPLDLEAARGGDVLEVDAAEPGRDHLDRPDDLVGVLAGQADRPGVDVGEPLEQRGLALHHRQRRARPDVAEPEHRRAVGHHGDAVALDGQPGDVLAGCCTAPC